MYQINKIILLLGICNNSSLNIFNNSNSSFETSGVCLGSRNPLNISCSFGQEFDTSQLFLNNSLEKLDLSKPIPPSLPYYQPYKPVSIRGSLPLSYEVQNLIRKSAEEGELMLSRARILELLAKINDCESILKEAEASGIIQLTIRKFEGYPEKHEFFSLLHDFISLEGLGWILKSIAKDAMTPTEKVNFEYGYIP